MRQREKPPASESIKPRFVSSEEFRDGQPWAAVGRATSASAATPLHGATNASALQAMEIFSLTQDLADLAAASSAQRPAMVQLDVSAPMPQSFFCAPLSVRRRAPSCNGHRHSAAKAKPACRYEAIDSSGRCNSSSTLPRSKNVEHISRDRLRLRAGKVPLPARIGGR